MLLSQLIVLFLLARLSIFPDFHLSLKCVHDNTVLMEYTFITK